MKNLLLPVLLLSLFTVIACRPGKPINTYSYEMPQAAAHKKITTAQMHDIIIKSCVERGWRATQIQQGLIEASIIVRNKHTVVVNIHYTANSYSIKYKSSVNMNYEGDKIHPNYNNWVLRLDQTIRSHLAAEGF